MAFEVATIVKDASYLDHAIFPAAIKNVMPRRFDAGAADSAAAERKMIGPGAFDHDFRTFLRTGTFGIGFDIAERLLQKFPVANCGASTEFLFTPSQDFAHILPGGGG